MRGNHKVWPLSTIIKPKYMLNSAQRLAQCSGGRGFEPHRGQRFFSLSPCGPISYLGLTLSRNYLGLLEHFNLPLLTLNICKSKPDVFSDTVNQYLEWSSENCMSCSVSKCRVVFSEEV